MSRAALLLALLLGLLGPGAVAAAAPPAPGLDVEAVEVGGGRALVVLTAADLALAEPVAVRASVAGEPVPARASLLDAAAPAGPADPAGAASDRAVLLLLDTSGSMAGEGIAAARLAARAYLDALPADVQVGLVTFADRPALAVAPTRDRAAVTAAVDGAVADGDTALLDAVALALDAFGAAGLGPQTQRRLVVLSDGVDTASAALPAAVRDRLAAEGVPADVVAFRYGAADPGGLDAVAGAAGGQVLTAQDAAQLGTAFTAIAQRFEQRVAVTLDLPAGLPGGAVELVVELGGARTAVTVDLAGAPAPPRDGPDPALLVALTVVFTALLLAGLLFLGGPGRREAARELAARIGRYGPNSAPAAAPGERSPARRALALTERLLRHVDGEGRLARRLDLAAITRRPAEWVLLWVAAGAACAAVLTVLGAPAVAGVLLGAALAGGAARVLVSVRIARRRAAFANQLPDVLQLVAGSLQSGFSLPQALAGVVRQDVQPAATEIARALAETRIGVDLEVALDRVADRMQSSDLRWTVMAVRIQRETGGNLAEVLLTTMGTMRERAQLRRHVRALSAEGRLSAAILLALPVVVAAWLFLARPGYMEPLYTTAFGLLMVAGALVLLVLGTLWMRKLVVVEV